MSSLSSAQTLVAAPQALQTESFFHAASSAKPLPEAPSAVLETAMPETMPEATAGTSSAAAPGGLDTPVKTSQPRMAPIHEKYIPAGWTAQTLTVHDKELVGLEDLYSPFTILGDIASAAYSHVFNGEPNYGTDKGAFGERLGATAIRDASEGVFTDMVFAPLLHEDPRYFVQGYEHHNVVERTLYAATRPIITRSDSGRSTINGAMLLGYLAASALSEPYYPKINQNFHDTAATFGGGIGGAAFGFFVSEFSDEVLQFLHLEKR